MSAKHRETGTTAGGARAVASGALAEVIGRGRTPEGALETRIASLTDPRDAALARELCYGALRWQPRLDALLGHLLDRPLRQRDADVHALLLVGLHQLVNLRVPPHAAVAETVRCAPGSKPWARGLVNAVLRRFERERDRLLADVDAGQEARYAHPAWLIETIRRDHPDAWMSILDANNSHPPLALRVNARRTDRDRYMESLRAAGHACRPVRHAPQAVVLESAADVQSLPGFAEGLATVQDAAAQLAADVVRAEPRQRVLDACAAPGGKTTHLLEREPSLEMLALDVDPDRCRRVRDNLARLGLEADVRAGDANDPDRWWDGRPFDRILLDVPCTGTGVIRRHPDIKTLRRAADVETLARAQARLLRSLWPLLARHGLLVYATCSVVSRENSDQVQQFLDAEPGASALPIEERWGHPSGPGRQTLPGEDDMDGFYYAVLAKR